MQPVTPALQRGKDVQDRLQLHIEEERGEREEVGGRRGERERGREGGLLNVCCPKCLLRGKGKTKKKTICSSGPCDLQLFHFRLL